MRKAIFLIFLFGILLFSGCISQSYYQKVDKSGNSEIQYAIDFTPMVTLLASQSGLPTDELMQNISKGIIEICVNTTQANPSTSCTADGAKMVLKRPFAPGGHYTFATESGIPYIVYKVNVNKIPSDQFNVDLSSLSGGLGGEEQTQEAIDLNAKDKNKLTAAQMKVLTGFEIKYTVEMPGEITKAVAGNTQATINGTKASFDVLKVMEDSAPLTIEARELNMVVVLGVGLVVVLVILAIAFFMFKKQ